MKELYDKISRKCSVVITKTYSTSFSSAVFMLSPEIRKDIYNIYGFVRLADEIVDSFHKYNKRELIDEFERTYNSAYRHGISSNPVVHSFISTVHKYKICDGLVKSFLKSMRMDLEAVDYVCEESYKSYIYGSAEVVGLMCLRVFVKSEPNKYNELKEAAMHLGSAFQKVNFLRDLKDDLNLLNRSYFPNLDFKCLTCKQKQLVIEEIKEDFKKAYKGIIKLPLEAKFGVYTAYLYYKTLLGKLQKTPTKELLQKRVRVGNHIKFGLLAKSFFEYKLNLI